MTKQLTAYMTKAMTGKYCDELVLTAITQKVLAQKYGIDVLDPVIVENVPYEHKLLETLDKEHLRRLWNRDKEMMQAAHILIDTTANAKSVGSEWEVGLVRYGYWKPVLRVYPGQDTVPYISQFEADGTCLSLEVAFIIAQARWGKWWQRAVWRLRLWNEKIPRFVARQIKFLFD